MKEEVWAIAGDKAPRPDGYGSQFFKDCWEVVSKDVVSGVMEFFQIARMSKSLNTTTITLVPKTSHVE